MIALSSSSEATSQISLEYPKLAAFMDICTLGNIPEYIRGALYVYIAFCRRDTVCQYLDVF
jgi:hypothetical protein